MAWDDLKDEGLDLMMRAFSSADSKRTSYKDAGLSIASDLATKYLNKGIARATRGKFPLGVKIEAGRGDAYVGAGRTWEF